MYSQELNGTNLIHSVYGVPSFLYESAIACVMVDVRRKRGTVESIVRKYLQSHHDAYSLLKSGIANISRLSRDISGEYPDLNMSSVRYSLNKIMEESAGSRDDISRVDSLLKESRITLQDKVTVVTSPVPLNIKYISATYLTDSVVYIVDEIMVGPMPRDSDVTMQRNVSLVHIFSSRDIGRAPGFVMRIAERLFISGINILQLISCANETLLVVRKDDGIRVYEALTGR